MRELYFEIRKFQAPLQGDDFWTIQTASAAYATAKILKEKGLTLREALRTDVLFGILY